MRQNAQALEEILKDFDSWVQAPFEVLADAEDLAEEQAPSGL